MSGEFLLQAIVYLFTAIICVPIAKRLGMGSVLGYLITGILIGPFVLGFIGSEGQDIMHFAEFGVVMMLFLVGLELKPAHFWKMRKMILGMGLMQVGATVLLIFSGALLLGLNWTSALAIALALSMSSTAIVLQSLKEKGLMNTSSGQGSFSILLFQDISVIPILALLPLLATAPMESSSEEHHNLLEGLSGGMQALLVLGAIIAVVLAGKFLIGALLKFVARSRLRELFSASALLIVFAIAYLMELVGLSPALGTFLAGVVLANSEYRHELESDLEPFKGLLLGLFFIAVGASINFDLITSQPGKIFSLVTMIMLVKASVLLATGKIFKLKTDQNLIMSMSLSQVGEFAFVLFSFIAQLRILDSVLTGTMMAVVAISMTITPLLLLLNEKLILPNFGTQEKEEKEADIIDEKHRVILAGFSHFGSTVGRFLRANGVEATILDNDSDRVDLLRKMGFKVYYGDATRHELLMSAGADEADILVSAIDSPETNILLVETVKKHFPRLKLLVRAENRFDAYKLMDLGVKNIYRESIDTSIRMGVDTLTMLGHRSFSALRSGQKFFRYDEASMWKLASKRHDMKQYLVSVREQIDEQEELLKADRLENPTMTDHAWDSTPLRASVKKKE